VANTAIIITDEWAPGSIVYLEWTDIFHIADFVAAVAVLAPLHWSLKQLQQTYASGAGADTGAKVRRREHEREHEHARLHMRLRVRARTTARPHHRAPASSLPRGARRRLPRANRRPRRWRGSRRCARSTSGPSPTSTPRACCSGSSRRA
jgi:hypothetical protein